MCLDSYVPEALGLKPESDPFISPSYACDEVNIDTKYSINLLIISIYLCSFS